MDHIGLFARWPEPGRVKTRLSPALPPSLACDLYRAMLGDALDAAAGAKADTRALYWAGAPADRSALPLPPGFEARDQRGPDLGARLAGAFAELLRSRADRALVMGADCPDLDAARLGLAFEALDGRDLALGPARDGGYYLIGLARPAPELFQDIDWGTPRVLDQTLGRASALGLRAARLDPLEDLDTPADLVRWLARAASGAAGGAPRTGAALRGLGLLP